MKTNKAPEKIYLYSNGHTLDNDWLYEAPEGFESFEYVRIDAFIEKAVKYFHERLEDTKVIDDYRDILVRGIQASYVSVDEFIEDFKDYMKEE